MTQTEVLKNVFLKGQELTAKQIRARYGIASPSKVVSRLREEGLTVYNFSRFDSKGRETRKYGLGRSQTA